MGSSSFSSVFSLLLLFVAIGQSSAAYATTTYCVASVSEFQTALTNAQGDNDDSHIKVRTGSYTLTSHLIYQPALTGAAVFNKLTIEGGFNAGCTSQTYDAEATTLQGDGSKNLWLIADTGSVSLRSIGFSNASVRVEDNYLADSCYAAGLVFDFRRVRIDAGSLWVRGAICHDVIIRDSLFINGASNDPAIPAGTSLQIWLLSHADINPASKVTLINTTVAEGGVTLSSCCDRLQSASIYNSIFRRSTTEIVSLATNIRFVNSRFDSTSFMSNGPLPAGSLVVGSVNNTAVDPDLSATYRPNLGSPMLNSGTSAVPNGPLARDVTGSTRLVGSAVDRGAVESPLDFSGTFTVTNTNASGAGSLADAVALANAQAGYNIIKFNIAGTCPRRIVLSSTLAIQDSVLIDGWSQPGSVKNSNDISWNAAPCVILDGNAAVGTGIETASQLGTGTLHVRGLAFEGYSASLWLSVGKDHLVHGNQFGGRVGAIGPTLAGNGFGITLTGFVTGAVVGGEDAEHRNLIGMSDVVGVQVFGVSTEGNQIVNNLIGLDKNGTSALPNSNGVLIAAKGTSVTLNRISGNSNDGVRLTSEIANGNVIADNTLGGSTIAGPFPLVGNSGNGVVLVQSAHNNTIGPNNIIGNNGDQGVRVYSTAAGHNAIIANHINLNGSLGIDLGEDGVSTNDSDPFVCDIVLGCSANRGQNFPALQSALRTISNNVAALSITGQLTTTYSGSPYRIDFYRSAACNASGYGEGSHWIGTKNVVVSNSGICASNNCSASFAYATLNTSNVAVGDTISASATSPLGDTSEFAACVIVQAGIADLLFANGFE